MSPSDANSGSQKNGTEPVLNVTFSARSLLMVPPSAPSASVMVARSAPIERCGSKNSLMETWMSLPSNCCCEYCRNSAARAISGMPPRAVVRSTLSTMLALPVAKS